MTADLICYAYVDGTHEYVCPLKADIDPENSSRVLWPRNSTTVKPPDYSAGKEIPVFDEAEGGWTVLPDYRGGFGYDPDGQPVLITKAGNPATFDPPLTKAPPPPPGASVPLSVSAAQALIQLSRIPFEDPTFPGVENLADATEQLVAGSSDRELKIWFSRAQRWYIDNPNVKKLGARFNLSDDQIKAAFVAASQIEE